MGAHCGLWLGAYVGQAYFCLTQCLETPTLAVMLNLLLGDSSSIRIIDAKIRVFGPKLAQWSHPSYLGLST